MALCDVPEDQELVGLSGTTQKQVNQALANMDPDVINTSSFISIKE